MTTEKNTVDRVNGMMRSELELLSELVSSSGARSALEVGMALASSTLAILKALKAAGAGRLTSVDPFQLVPAESATGGMTGYGGAGMGLVREAGLSDLHTLIAAPDYLALPKLVEAGAHFDFILIDGYHSFDYALVDFFFADLLLAPKGMLVFHDSGCQAVNRVCAFVANNKAYRRVGPPLALIHKSLTRRFARRVGNLVTGRAAEFNERSSRWKSLAVFVKEADGMAQEFEVRGI